MVDDERAEIFAAAASAAARLTLAGSCARRKRKAAEPGQPPSLDALDAYGDAVLSPNALEHVHQQRMCSRGRLGAGTWFSKSATRENDPICSKSGSVC